MTATGSLEAAFKCDFGGREGWGHVIRSSALAAEFRKRGWSTTLWTSSEVGILPESVRASFSRATPDFPTNATALNVDEMYTPDAVFEALAAQWRALPGRRVLAGVDDMQKRSMAAFDLVINAEIGLRSAGYSAAKSLLGERYALLRSGFATPEPLPAWNLPENVSPVLIMMGGTDAFGYNLRVLRSLEKWRRESVAPVLVMGESKSDRFEIMDALRRFPESRVLERQHASQLAAWMLKCAFGVIACGSSIYELAAMQLPFIGLSLVDNQSASALKVRELWGMPVVAREGRHDEVLELDEELDRIARLGRKPYSSVDTAGCQRVCDDILESL